MRPAHKLLVRIDSSMRYEWTETSSSLRGVAGRVALVILALACAICAQEHARPRVGLVLSGGARGGAHVGVLEVLEELRVPVDYVVGTSIGAIVGGLYAAGHSPDRIEEVFASVEWSALLSDRPPRDELWFRRREDDRVFQVDLELGWSGGEPVVPPGLILGLMLGPMYLGFGLTEGGDRAAFVLVGPTL